MAQQEKTSKPVHGDTEVDPALAHKDQESRTGASGLNAGHPETGATNVNRGGKPGDDPMRNPLASGNPVNANVPYTAPAGSQEQAQQAQRPGGAGAPGTGGADPQTWSEETKNQQATSRRSRAESGTTAPSRPEK